MKNSLILKDFIFFLFYIDGLSILVKIKKSIVRVKKNKS